MERCIAQRKLLYSTKGSSVRKELVVRVGEPHFDEKGMAKCTVEWDGLFENFTDIYGMDSMQALHLATDIDSLLMKLQNKYEFFWSSGEPYFDDE